MATAKLLAVVTQIAELVRPLASGHGGNAPLLKLENLLAEAKAEALAVDNRLPRQVEALTTDVATLMAQVEAIRAHPALSVPSLDPPPADPGDSHD